MSHPEITLLRSSKESYELAYHVWWIVLCIPPAPCEYSMAADENEMPGRTKNWIMAGNLVRKKDWRKMETVLLIIGEMSSTLGRPDAMGEDAEEVTIADEHTV